MSRFLPAVLLAVAFSGPAAAQGKPTADEQKFIGTWEGPYQSDQAAPGGLRLVIAKDSVWKVTMEVVSDQPIPAGEITDFKREGTTISWSQLIMGMTCVAQATLTEGTLRGESNCDSGAITATWVLLKK